jgi:LytS/YehU family sensor histidine kinase
MLENERLLRENLHAKFETLRQQVNPHFLFNSLSTLKTMMHNNVDKAEEYLLRLSDVFRYSLQVIDIEKVTLKEELDILEAYCYMLKGRFGENLSIDIQIDQLHFCMYIPPFSLQIIVENCVKHNIVSKDKPLFIKIFSNQAKQITILNNLQPKNSVETSSRVGLANIEKRYQYLSGQHIEIIETPETFNVIIPLIESK